MSGTETPDGWLCALRRDRFLRRILVLAVAIRLVYSFAVFPAIGERLHWKGVDDGYDEIARHLIGGHGFVDRPGDIPNLVTPPGYVFFLAALYRVFGEEVGEGVRVRIAQPLLDAGTCLLIYLIGSRLFRNRRVGRVASLVWALYPQVVVYNARVAPEILFIFLLTAMMYAFIRLREEGRLRDAIAAGVLWGLAVLVKEKVLFLPPVLFLLVLAARAIPRPRRAVLALLLLASMGLATAPWALRGYAVAGTFVPITLRSGRALNQGMNEDFSGADESMMRYFEEGRERRWRELPATEEERAARARKSAREENALVGKAFDRIAGDPVAFVKAFLVKLGAFWYFGQPKVVAGNLVVQLPILSFAVVGYVRGWRRRDLSSFLALTLYFLIIHALTIVRMRYSLPIMPETILVASSAALPLFDRLAAPRAAARPVQSGRPPADSR
ncbi:MAG: phospholipid carrier-dependent glycosyltransferase [Candidatus Latescibacterota bacterium]|nr:MAG: phospholipid carrier-dependent glycosyltransferase [Candidatus Latescibacterota bacterium]